jgi:tetratricopeptide (TPR) repeat protein
VPRLKGQRKYAYDYAAFGATVAELRRRLGLTLDELARAWGVHKGNRGTLKQVEAGTRGLSERQRSDLVAAIATFAAAQGVPAPEDRLHRVAGLPTLPRVTRRALLTGMAATSIAGVLPGEERALAGAADAARVGAPEPWLKRLAAGRALGARVEHEVAREALVLVRAHTALPAAALTAANLALAWWRQDAFGAATKLADEVLRELDLDLLPPEGGASIETISARLRDRVGHEGHAIGLEAYAQVARLRGHAWHVQERFARAERAYAAWLTIGRVLADRSTEADALRFLGKAVLEQGVSVDPEGLDWRSADRPERLHRAIGYFRQARAIRPPNDEVGLADDWRQEARARHVLLAVDGDASAQRAAKRAEDEAEGRAGSGAGWTRMYLFLDRGLWHLADVQVAKAEEQLAQAVDLAIESRSDATLSPALGQLGTVYSLDPRLRRRAIDHCVAALLVWPWPFDTRDSRKSVHLFRHLDAEMTDVVRFTNTDSNLRDRVMERLAGDVDQHVLKVGRRLTGGVAVA